MQLTPRRCCCGSFGTCSDIQVKLQYLGMDDGQANSSAEDVNREPQIQGEAGGRDIHKKTVKERGRETAKETDRNRRSGWSYLQTAEHKTLPL